MSRAASLLSRVIFGLLIVATFTAFFVAQKLKRTEPLVYAVQMGKFISPNDDGRRERARLRFRIKQADVVTVEVIARDGRRVRTLADARARQAGSLHYSWDGRDRFGRPLPDGAYRVRIALRRSGRSFVPDKTFRVDTVAPKMQVVATVPNTVAIAGGKRSVRVRYSGVPASNRAEFLVYRAGRDSASPQPVAAFAGSRNARRGYWNITVGRFVQRRSACFGPLVSRGRARPAPAGRYVVAVRACDSAGNVATGPAVLPPRRGKVEGRPGVTVRGVELAPAMFAVAPGQVLRLPIYSPYLRHEYRLLAPNGDIEKRGKLRGKALIMRVPQVAGGLYQLQLTARGNTALRDRRATVPVAVRGTRRAKVLIVQPAIAWQADNPVDIDHDGFADSFSALPAGRSVRVSTTRGLAQGRLPSAFTTTEAPVTALVASNGARFDTTTDYALAAKPAGWLARRKLVVLAGNAQWQPPAVGLALREFVARGGSVMFFGAKQLRQTARVAGGQISGPSPPSLRDIFGEITRVSAQAPAPVVPFVDPYSAFPGPVGLFTEFDQSQRLAAGAKSQLAAGRDSEHPAVEIYKFGRGRVVRVGVPGWTAALAPGTFDPQVAQVTRTLLSEVGP
ncbi:MAG: hypothetical protein JHC87_01445 [Thermoleophilaceae bacterium]|nr:hypothetical protein [Thermoleophilaceae bacterium]